MSMGYIPQEILDEIIAKNDIVSVVGEYVPLKRRGNNYQGLCPFHHEKTPSFSVSPTKQIFHCFGCGKGGNVFRFIMEIEGLSFPEAVEKLAKRANITLPERELSPVEKKKIEERKRYLQINTAAAKYYHKVLLETEAGKVFRQYLQQRGITQEMIIKFQLGAAPMGWDNLYQFMRSHGVQPEELLQLGLISPGKQSNRYYDRFRGRLMFPICNDRGEVIAFGGRIIDKDSSPQKYLNSPDTPLFHKSKNLYGLHLAKNAIRDKDMAVIVEGYMDVISCHQHGITNAVAPLGTAFTPEQGKLLMRNSYQMAIAFDGDGAGMKATTRCLDVLSDLGCKCRVVHIPNNADPDEYLKTQGKEAFEQLILKSQDLIVYKISRLMENINIDSISGKQEIVEKLLPDLLKLSSAVALESAIREVCSRIQVSEKALWDELRQYRQKQQAGVSVAKAQETEATSEKEEIVSAGEMEMLVLGMLYTQPEKLAMIKQLGGGRLFSPALHKLYQAFEEQIERQGAVNSGEIAAEYSDLLAKCLVTAERVAEKEQNVQLYILQLRQEQLDNQYQLLVRKLAEAEKMGATEEMLQALKDLEKVRQEKRECEVMRKGE